METGGDELVLARGSGMGMEGERVLMARTCSKAWSGEKSIFFPVNPTPESTSLKHPRLQSFEPLVLCFFLSYVIQLSPL